MDTISIPDTNSEKLEDMSFWGKYLFLRKPGKFVQFDPEMGQIVNEWKEPVKYCIQNDMLYTIDENEIFIFDLKVHVTISPIFKECAEQMHKN